MTFFKKATEPRKEPARAGAGRTAGCHRIYPCHSAASQSTKKKGNPRKMDYPNKARGCVVVAADLGRTFHIDLLNLSIPSPKASVGHFKINRILVLTVLRSI